MPALDRCPLAPRVAVLPWPDPIPWPTRFERLFAPAGGRSVPMCVDICLQPIPCFLTPYRLTPAKTPGLHSPAQDRFARQPMQRWILPTRLLPQVGREQRRVHEWYILERMPMPGRTAQERFPRDAARPPRFHESAGCRAAPPYGSVCSSPNFARSSFGSG